MSYLSWVKTMLVSPSWRRTQWRQELLDGLKIYRQKRKSPQTKFLSEILEAGKEAKFVGFTPGIEYIKEKADPEISGSEKSQLECIWKHNHMNPAMLYWVEDLRAFIIVGPGLTFDRSILNEIGMSDEKGKGVMG